MKRYADFEVWVGSGSPNDTGDWVFPVHVITAPSAPATGTLTLPLTDGQFTTKVAQVCGVGADLKSRQDFGQLLFDALFNGDIKDAWLVSKGRIDAAKDGLHMRLCLNAPELSLLPWELLFDDDFLAINASFGLSRYLPIPEPPAYSIELPLRILISMHSPQGLPA